MPIFFLTKFPSGALVLSPEQKKKITQSKKPASASHRQAGAPPNIQRSVPDDCCIAISSAMESRRAEAFNPDYFCCRHDAVARTKYTYNTELLMGAAYCASRVRNELECPKRPTQRKNKFSAGRKAMHTVKLELHMDAGMTVRMRTRVCSKSRKVVSTDIELTYPVLLPEGPNQKLC